jgi:hypothetical protein
MSSGSVFQEHTRCFVAHLQQHHHDVVKKRYTHDELKGVHDRFYPGTPGTFTYVWQILLRTGVLAFDGEWATFNSVAQDPSSPKLPVHNKRYLKELKEKLKRLNQSRLMTSNPPATESKPIPLNSLGTNQIMPRKTAVGSPKKESWQPIVVDQHVTVGRDEDVIQKKKVRCNMCNKNYENQKAYELHQRSKEHVIAVLLKEFRHEQ